MKAKDLIENLEDDDDVYDKDDFMAATEPSTVWIGYLVDDDDGGKVFAGTTYDALKPQLVHYAFTASDHLHGVKGMDSDAIVEWLQEHADLDISEIEMLGPVSRVICVAVIDTAGTPYYMAGATLQDAQARTADWCREAWDGPGDKPLPSDPKAAIETYLERWHNESIEYHNVRVHEPRNLD